MRYGTSYFTGTRAAGKSQSGMKRRIDTMLKSLPVEFTFAGFTWPRYIAELRRSKYDKRTSRSVYYHAPRPEQAGKGKSFYLNDAGSPDRWKWADEITAARIEHTGWYTDEYGDGEKIRGIVVYLPHGKMLAGWGMGEGMASSMEGDTIYTDEVEAAWAADQAAEYAAEKERDYQAEQEAEREAEERNQGGDEEETEGY